MARIIRWRESVEANRLAKDRTPYGLGFIPFAIYMGPSLILSLIGLAVRHKMRKKIGGYFFRPTSNLGKTQ